MLVLDSGCNLSVQVHRREIVTDQVELDTQEAEEMFDHQALPYNSIQSECWHKRSTPSTLYLSVNSSKELGLNI